MAEQVVEESMLGSMEQRGVGRESLHSQRQAQISVRQSPHREPKKWVRGVKNQNSPENAARERSRVRNLRQAFHSLQAALPSVPPDTKLSKLDVLVLATNYIAHLTDTLDQDGALGDHALSQRAEGYLHPVKKWPMRSLLYCGSVGELLTGSQTNQDELQSLKPPHTVTAD